MQTIRRCGSNLSLTFAVVLASLLLVFPAALAFGQAITLSQSGARYAGSGAAGFTGDFGPATTVSLNSPSYLVFDAAGNQYISDTLNNCVRRIDTSGNISTVAGLALTGQGDTCNSSSNATPTAAQGLLRPAGLALDSANRLYIADSGHNCVRMLPSGGSGVASLSTVAGTCGPTGSASVTPSPNGLAIDATGNLYISLGDNSSAAPVNQVVQHATGSDPSGVCLIAGDASANVARSCGNANGIRLAHPAGLAFDVAGDLFIADTGNNCVREVEALTTQKTAVGRCLNDGSGSADMGLRNPFGLAFSPMQTLFITESSPDNVVSYTLGAATTNVAGGLITGIAGTYSQSQDGKSALGTPLNAPRGIAFDALGSFVIADSGNNIARKLSNNIMFPPTPVGSSSSILPLTFAVKAGVNLSVAPTTEFSITSNSCTGVINPGASLTTCQIFVRFTPTRPGIRNSPLRISDAISNSTFTFGLQGSGTGALSLFTPGIVSTLAAHLSAPSTLTTDASGNVYVLETGSPDLRLIPSAGGSARVLLSSGLVTPTAAAQDAAGNTYVADAAHNTIARFGVDGSVDPAYVTGLDSPQALTIDGFGNLFIAQGGSSHNVIEAYASGAQHVIAGSGNVVGADGVLAGTAKFLSPAALTADLNGILYIADSAAHLVYAVDKAGYIHEVAGNGSTTTSVPGQATGTALLSPVSLAVDAAGDIYIADKAANLVYVVYASSSNGINIAPVFGTGIAGSLGDGGFSPLAQVNAPVSIAVDGSSNLFIIDSGASSVREISYANPTVNFGSILVGQTSPLQMQSVLNVGTENLNLTTPFATSDAHFTVDQNASNCGTTILSGSLCGLAFNFSPTASVAYNATATLVSNSYNSPQPIQLNGQGRQLIVPQLLLPTQTEVYGQPFPMGAVFTNAGTTAPGGTITFASNGTVLCTVSATFTNGLVTCNAASTGLPVGSYPVTFTYSGDGNYAPATGNLSLTVTPQPLSEIVDSTSRPYGASNPAFTGRLIGVTNNDTILVSFSTSANSTSTIGVYPITAALSPVGSASLSNYTVNNIPGALTVTQAPVSVTVLNATRQYGSPNPAFTSTIGTAANGDSFAVTYSTNAALTSTVGTYPIAATVTGATAGNYLLTVNPGTLTVTPAPLTVTVNSATRAYGETNPALSSRITGALNGDSFTESLSTTATVSSPVGAYPITDAVSGTKATNYSLTVVPGTLTVTQGRIGFTLPAESEIYGQSFPETVSLNQGSGAAPTGTVTFTSGGKTLCSITGNFTSPNVVCNAPASGLSAGSYTVNLTYSGDSNYSPATGTTVLVISPATLTVKANDASRSYGAANPSFTGTLSGLVAGDTATASYVTTAVTNSPVGSYAIVPSVTGTAIANYTVVPVNGNLTITANTNAITINVNNAARLFGTPNPALTGAVSGMLPGDDVTVTYTTSATVMSNTGNYPIVATLSGAAAANYIPTVHNGMLAVSPAATTTTVVTSGSPADTGSSVTLTANVIAAAAIPAGTVTFTEGSTVLGTGTLNASGVATLTTSTLSLGQHNVLATFASTTNFTGSSASLTQVMKAPVGSFTLSASPASQFIHGAGSTVYQVTLTAVGAFNGPVALTCNGLPADATCTFANSTPTLSNGGTVTTTMTVTNTVADAKLGKAPTFNPGQLAPITAAAVFPVELPVLGIFFAGARRRRNLGPQRMRLLLVILFTAGILGLSGCGCPTTNYKTYTININATSTTFPAPAQSTSVLLSVGQPQ